MTATFHKLHYNSTADTKNLSSLLIIVYVLTDVGFAIGGDSGIKYLVLQVHYASVDAFRGNTCVLSTIYTSHVNPLIPDIKMQIPLTILHTFLIELVRRICLNIN